jgi:hypothetical protein
MIFSTWPAPFPQNEHFGSTRDRPLSMDDASQVYSFENALSAISYQLSAKPDVLLFFADR